MDPESLEITQNMLEEVVKGWTERRHQACCQDGGWCPLQTQKDQVWEIMGLSGQKLPSEQMDVLGWSRRCDIQTTLKQGRRPKGFGRGAVKAGVSREGRARFQLE